MQLTGAHFSPSSKNKKIHPEKISYTLILKKFLHFLKRKLFLYFREWKPRKNFSSENKIDPTEKISVTPILKNFLYFLKRKVCIYFRKRRPPKNSLYFKKRNFLIFQETSYISKSNFPSLKNKKNPLLKIFLCFRKWNFLKKLFIFLDRTCKA